MLKFNIQTANSLEVTQAVMVNSKLALTPAIDNEILLKEVVSKNQT